MKIMKRFRFTLITLFTLFTSVSCSNVIITPYHNEDTSIVVRLVESEYFNVASINPVKVNKGDSVSFAVNIDERYEFDENSEGTYNDATNTYTISNIQSSRNVEMLVRKKEFFTLYVINDEERGEVTISPLKSLYLYGEMVTVSLQTYEENEFMCYTKTNPYRAINNWTPSGRPLSFTSTYTFPIKEDLVLVTNYFTSDLLQIEYFSNGGKTIDGEDSFVLDYTIPYQFTNPTTVLGTYYFNRDGYTLESYNTKADGSGKRIGLGSSVDISYAEDNKIKLYAQWCKWTDIDKFSFEYNKEDDTYSISSYNGNDNEVVLPNTYKDKKVTHLLRNSIKNKNLTSLVLNTNLTNIENNSIVDCPNLKSIVFFTTVSKMTSRFISNCPNFAEFKLNNTLYAFSAAKRDADMIGQLQSIANASKPRLILYGPSTLRYNQSVDPFKAQYPDKFVYLCGLQAGTNYKLGLELLLNVVNSNDYVMPQLHEISLALDTGGSDTFTYLKYNFDVLLGLNIQDYIKNVFDNLPYFVRDYSANQHDDIYLCQRFAGYNADGMYNYESSTDDPDNKDPSTVFIFEKYSKTTNFDYIPYLFNKYNIPNSHVLPCWSSYNENSVTNTEIFIEYENFAKAQLPNYTFFDSILNNIYPGILFRKNDSVHLSMKGCLYRANLWCQEILDKGIVLYE